MEFADVLRARYSTRLFTDQDVPDLLLHEVLAAGLGMPHAGNTYAWQALVLRRPARNHPRWPQVHAALHSQDYLAQAPVLLVFGVRPQFWLDHQPGNVAAMMASGAMHRERHGTLFEHLGTVREPDRALRTLLIGEAMLAVGACALAATNAGLGTALAGGRPVELAAALEVPTGTYLCPAGILALGWPADLDRPRAGKPALSQVVCDGDWSTPLTAPQIAV